MIQHPSAVASQNEAEVAASEVLQRGGSVADALTAGFLSAAGKYDWVLFSPCVVLVVGLGAGARVFDGRCVQPGLGLSRPRGFVDTAEIPVGSRLSVSRGLSALVLMHSYMGKLSLAELCGPAVTLAKEALAPARANVLNLIRRLGLMGLKTTEVYNVLIQLGGPVAGGILTETDMEQTRPEESSARVLLANDKLTNDKTFYSVPWNADVDIGNSKEHVIICVDRFGTMGILSYQQYAPGLWVDALQVSLPCNATPVMRGVPRVSPGTPIPSGHSMMICQQGRDAMVACAATQPRREEEIMEACCSVISTNPISESSNMYGLLVSEGRHVTKVRSALQGMRDET